MEPLTITEIHKLSHTRTRDLGNPLEIIGDVSGISERKFVSKSILFQCINCGVVNEVYQKFPYDEYLEPKRCLSLDSGGCGLSLSNTDFEAKPNLSTLTDLYIIKLTQKKCSFSLYLHSNKSPPKVGDRITFECKPEPIIYKKNGYIKGWRGAVDNYKIASNIN
jgi:hypothetical protein